MTPQTTALVMIVLACTLPAQGVTVTATSLTELQASANIVTESVPASSSVTGGVTLNADDPIAPTASANLFLSLEQTPSHILVKLMESGNAGFLGPFAQGVAVVGPNRIQVEFRSPRPMLAKLSVRHCARWSTTSGRYSARVDVPGKGSVTTTANELCLFVTKSQTFDVFIDNNGLRVVLETQGSAAGSNRGGGGHFFGTTELELVPDPGSPCDIVPYGTSCGASLTAASDLLHPGQHVVTLEDPSRPPVAVLGLGVRRQAVPIVGGCTLYHDLLVALPWSIDPNGKAVLVFDPPPIPGLTFKAQAATLQGGVLHTTNALDVICR